MFASQVTHDSVALGQLHIAINVIWQLKRTMPATQVIASIQQL